jgi:hypothetical protein
MTFFRSIPQRRVLIACAALAAMSAALPAHADIYKCLGDNSQPVYQDTPCRAGREMRDFQADPATVSVIPFATEPSAPAPAASSRKTTKREPANARNSPAPKSSRTRGKQTLPAGNASERRFLHAGMSEAEVLARIGAPDIRSGGTGRRGSARWSYLPADGDPGMITTLHFQAGEVTQIDRKPSR